MSARKLNTSSHSCLSDSTLRSISDDGYEILPYPSDEEEDDERKQSVGDEGNDEEDNPFEATEKCNARNDESLKEGKQEMVSSDSVTSSSQDDGVIRGSKKQEHTPPNEKQINIGFGNAIIQLAKNQVAKVEIHTPKALNKVSVPNHHKSVQTLERIHFNTCLLLLNLSTPKASEFISTKKKRYRVASIVKHF